MKDVLKRIKDFWGKFTKKVKILIGAGAAAVLIGAIVIAALLNHKDYVTLFTGITADETTEILGKLQDLGVEYTSSGGAILVPEGVADSTRAKLAQEGYPKSGFTYDIFINNAGGMTTDMEKQTYKLYQLQNYISATIRLFDGVQDAKVIIALPDTQKYVLDDSATKGSASVTVIMQEDKELSAAQADGIRRLVAGGVPGMQMEDVAVFDGYGIEILAENESETSGDVASEIAGIIENQISRKVAYVLEPFFGPGNVRVAAKCQVNMEKLLRESITYSTPDKIDAEDKMGIISNEEWSREASGDGVAASGIVGTETNSEIPQYTANATELNDGYYALSGARDYLVNQIKEQGEIAPGMIQDVTVSVSVNSTGMPEGLTTNRLLGLVGNAAGIAAENWETKISVVNAPFWTEPQEEEPVKEVDGEVLVILRSYLPLIIAAAVLLLILLIVLVIVLRKRAKKKKRLAAEVAEAARLAAEQEAMNAALAAEEEALAAKNDILNIKNERSRELREAVREFAENNPEISAQMLRSWLHGGDDNG